MEAFRVSLFFILHSRLSHFGANCPVSLKIQIAAATSRARNSRKELIHSLSTSWPARCFPSEEMSSYEPIYKKMASSLEQSHAENSPETARKFDPARHIAPVVAHELNNMLTIVQGYADRLLARHSDDPGLRPHLNLISEASKRAAAIVRAATPPNANDTFRRQKNSEQVPVAA
jgi:signal transduction histidine kinase